MQFDPSSKDRLTDLIWGTGSLGDHAHAIALENLYPDVQLLTLDRLAKRNTLTNGRTLSLK